MRTIPLALASLTLLAAAAAQDKDPLAAARARLHKALAAAAAQPSGAFTAKWGPLPDPKAAAGGQQNVFVVLGGGSAPGEAKGSWSPELLQVDFGDDGQVAFAGRRMVAKDGDTDWCLRRGLLASGLELPFVPDVPQLLRQLAGTDLAVVHQEVGTRDDRPVEILSVTLNADQVTDAMWGGTMPNGASGFGGFAVRAMLVAGPGGAGAAKPTMPKPEATVDVAVVIDPATATVRTITLRSYQKNDMQAAGGMVVFGAAGGVQANGDEEDEEDAEAEEKAKNQPLQFENGLPKRSRKKQSVNDYTIELTDLGTAKSPKLPAAAKALLGVQ